MLNMVALVGYVATTPDSRMTPNGVPVASFRLRHSTGRKERDNPDRWESMFVSVEGWKKTAEKIGELEQGMMVSVNGKLTIQQYTDREGVKREKAVIEAFEVAQLKGGGKSGSNDQEIPF